MLIENKKLLMDILARADKVRSRKDGDELYVYYKDKKMYFVSQQKRYQLYSTTDIEAYTAETSEMETDYWSRHREYHYRYCDYDYRDSKVKREKVVIIPESIEAFKKDYPYSCYNEFDEYISLVLRNNHSWRTESKSYLLANFMGSTIEKPQLEKMMKTDFKKFVFGWMANLNDDRYRKAFINGKNFSEITTMPNWLWKKLLEQGISIDKWDVLRIWNKQLLQESKKKAEEIKKNGGKTKEKDIHGFDEGTVDAILNLDVTDSKTLKEIKRIINNSRDENGERLFTIKSLFNYLERVDMYQAIPCYTAIEILSDYIRMCKDMNVEPRIDSDSLKREHDIAARNYSIYLEAKRAKFESEKGDLFVERSKVLQKYEFEDENYTAIVPKNITDLINEGRNNHNCVGSYVNMFAKGTSNIFFIRKKSSPEKSYITIELNGTCNDYKQAYLASNQRITEPGDWLFINKWLENNKTLA